MLFDLVSANSATLVDAFYQVLQGNEEAATFLHHKVVEERLKPSLENWLQETFASPSRFDPVAFELRQKAIGEVHARIKVPIYLVQTGALEIRRRLADLIRSAPASWQDRWQAIVLADERLHLSMALMSQSYENGVVNRTRLEEAYRLFSLDQDVHYEREVQRGSLMEWAQATFFQLLDPDETPALARLAQAPFGLWIRHRAGVMFEHSRELAAISERLRAIDETFLPRLETEATSGTRLSLKTLRSAVNEIAFLLNEMFQGLSGMESGRDALTRVLNRRFLPSILAREIRFANLHHKAFTILMLDVDHFKQINDRYGHQIGDVVLRQVAEVIGDNIRPSDFLFRYGGEEFLIVLVETGISEARQIADRLRTALAEREITTGEDRLRVTASLGVAEHDGHPDPERLIGKADGALYQAKVAGRNRVETG